VPEQFFINGKFCAQPTTGVQRYAQGLVAALDARLASSASASRWTLLVPRGARAPALQAIGVRALASPVPGGLHVWEQFALPRASRNGLLINLAGSSAAWAGRQAVVLHDAALFDHPQAYAWTFRRWYRWLFERLARRGAVLITVSEFSRQRLSLALGLARERFAVVPGGADHLRPVRADPALLVRHGLDRLPYLLAVGSANPTKNLAALVAAWRALARTDVRLVLVGGSNERVFAGTADRPAASGVIELGRVDDAALKALYARAKGLVFPSLYEGFGLPPLEAMDCGCPVAAARTASLPQVCGDAALWFDPRSQDDMMTAMRRLLDEPALGEQLRQRGHARAALFRWDASAAALLAAVGAAPP
jgi:glycosyltransferase involved in cell wall biosynthesis